MRGQNRHRFRAVLAGAIVASTSAVFADLGTPLTDAARSADREAVRRLVKQGVDVNATQGDGSTALHWASYRDDGEIADQLLRAGAKVNAANDLGATPLWAASENGSDAMVARLLQAGADPNLALQSGETPLMVASRVGSAAVVSRLLARGAKVNVSATRGQTALMWAVSQKHPEVVKLLIAAGSDIHARSSVWSKVMAVSPHGMLQYNRSIPHGGDTALMFAARVGDFESAKLLVAAGANPNDTEAGGVTATMMAAHSGFRDIVEFLLDKGADPNLGDAGFTALHAAIMRRDERMVTALLAHKADPNAPVTMWTPTRRSSRDWNFNPELVGATPFWLASRVASANIMRLLVENGANARIIHHVEYHAGDPPEPRSQTTTPLMAAVGMGGGAAWVQPERSQREALALEAAKVAIELGSDLNAANDDGRTALDGAKAARFDDLAAFLSEQGAVAGKPKGKPLGFSGNR
jgi:ankyrin repeat protein